VGGWVLAGLVAGADRAALSARRKREGPHEASNCRIPPRPAYSTFRSSRSASFLAFFTPARSVGSSRTRGRAPTPHLVAGSRPGPRVSGTRRRGSGVAGALLLLLLISCGSGSTVRHKHTHAWGRVRSSADHLFCTFTTCLCPQQRELSSPQLVALTKWLWLWRYAAQTIP
jgi:hypothetical protein